MNKLTPPPERATGSRRPLFLLAMLVLLAPLLGISAYQLAAGQSDREARENLSAIVLLKATQLENWLAEREGDAMTLANSPGFIERVRTAQRIGDAHQLALVRDRLTALQQSYGYESISLFDIGGRAMLQIGPAGTPDHVATFTDVKHPLTDNGDIVLGELFQDAAGRTHLDVSLRLVLPGVAGPEPVGLIVLHVNPANFLFPLVKAWPTASASGEIYIARQDGDQALVMSELRYRPGLAMQLRFPGNSQTFPVAIALRNHDIGTAEGIDYRGMATISAYRPVPRTNWVVVAKIDRAEALAPARLLGIWVGAIAMLSSIAVAAALFFLLRQRALTERLTAQVQTDQLLRNFYTLPFIGMAISSPDTKQWVRFNDRLCEILGYTRDQMATKGWDEMTHPDDLEKNNALFDSVMRGESEGYQLDKRFIRADGSIVFTIVNARCVRKADGKPDFFLTTVQDISQRKADEARIVRLGQLYAALGQCNEAIMRSATAEQLYADVCRAVVESGGVMFAWIGLKNTAACEVRPVASFGNGVEYLQNLQISLRADEPLGNGPTGTAIREDRPFWCQDFRNDPATAPWHKRAERHGWQASASLPIHQDGAVIGGLTLYADTVNAFDAEAQQLLLRIVANISFALDNMAHDAARRRSEKQLLESEERYRLLFSSSLDAVMLGAPDGRILEANSAACRMLQRSEEEIRRLGRTGLFDASDPRLAAGVQERARTGRFVGELTGIRGDGSRFPAEVSSSIFTNSEGEQRSSVILRDITDRKLAEQALAASEQQFRGMIEQSVAGFFIVQNNKLAYANQRLADILGCASPQELIGQDALFMVPEEDRPPLEEEMRKGLTGQGAGISKVARSRRKDGVMIDIGAHYFVSNYRGQLAIIGLAQDISEKKRAEDEIQRYVKQLEGAFMRTVEVATTISEMRDPYTAGHEKRVAAIAVAIGTEMGFDTHRQEGLRVAGYLHDVGKITVPSEILAKPGKLSETEFLLVKQHPQAGYEVLKNVGFPWPVAEVALLHHERIDGSGYPKGLKGEEIPIEARIMAVADVVESMASHRPYRPGLGIDKALQEIERGRGTSYDAEVADICIRLFREKGYTIPA